MRLRLIVIPQRLTKRRDHADHTQSTNARTSWSAPPNNPNPILPSGASARRLHRPRQASGAIGGARMGAGKEQDELMALSTYYLIVTLGGILVMVIGCTPFY